MAQQYYTVATNKGLELINAHVLDGNKPFMADNWYIALGDGNLTPSKYTTQLVHKIFDKNSEGYQGFTVTTDKEWGRMAKITLPDVLKGQVIREIGLFNENDELMLVANTYINLSEMSDNDGLSSILQPAISLKAIPDNVQILNVPEGDYVTHEVYDPTVENLIQTLANKLNLSLDNLNEVGQAKIDGKASVNLDNLSATAQAMLDKKVEIEALLEQNGYAKFTWKDGNKISKLIVQWGFTTVSSVTLPITYSNNKYSLVIKPIIKEGATMLGLSFKEPSQTTTTFDITINQNQTSSSWFTIGY
nr:MAG TPA: tail-collar fiber protein [Caudoviricetes sp.]